MALWVQLKDSLQIDVWHMGMMSDDDDEYQHLSTSMKSVKCFKVSDSDIENLNKIIPKDLN